MSRHSKQNTAVFSQKRADICSKMSRHIKQKAAESPFSRPQASFFSPKRTKKSTKAKRRKETPLPETTTKSNEKRSTEKHFPEKAQPSDNRTALRFIFLRFSLPPPHPAANSAFSSGRNSILSECQSLQKKEEKRLHASPESSWLNTQPFQLQSLCRAATDRQTTAYNYETILFINFQNDLSGKNGCGIKLKTIFVRLQPTRKA